MILKVFERLGKGDQKEHSQLISNLSDDEFREYLDTIQSMVEGRSTKRSGLAKGRGSEERSDSIEGTDLTAETDYVEEEDFIEETGFIEEEPELEELFDRVEIIASQLEEGDISLEESFALYNKGLSLLKESNNIIDEIEKKVLVLDSKGETYEL
jgi:exodeoxyribonuclease VII small subunit